MEVRRWRRFRRGPEGLLPLRRVRDISNTVSCWYCDIKFTILNEPTFRFGQNHAGGLKLWFSMGIGFGLAALFSVALILEWEAALAFSSYGGSMQFSSLMNGFVFGVFPPVMGLRRTLIDAVYMCLSSVISVCTHEYGHALAAASEGIRIEYVAVFLAGLFPGALVAIRHELMEALPNIAALRVYCAGIWHNAAVCALCVLLLFLLPLIAYPFYTHGEHLMVLDLSSTSPLSEYLAPGDLIVSLNGIHVHNPREWVKTISAIKKRATLSESPNWSGDRIASLLDRRAYCVPNYLIAQNMHIWVKENQTTCPDELTAFEPLSCFPSTAMDDLSIQDIELKNRENIYCLSARDIVKQKKCGAWLGTPSNTSNCLCSEDESCLAPVQMPDIIWLEMTYSRHYIKKCQQIGDHLLQSNGSFDSSKIDCGGTFVFIGDVISMAHSLSLSAYQPRWPFSFGASIPHVLDKLLTCTFYVSLSLALVNSLPVYFLDGESILDVSLCCLTFLSPRTRVKILRFCLIGGTLLSILVFLRIFLSFLL